MSVTTPKVHPGVHHDTPEQKDRKERTAVWLFIGGDMVFVALEIFTWFYLRGLNPNNGWRWVGSSAANPWTDMVGNTHTMEVPKASVAWTIGVSLLTLLVGLIAWWAEGLAKGKAKRSVVSGALGLTFLASLVAIGFQIAQFQVLPFQTTWGTYASTFEFFMGSNLAHLIIVAIVCLGLWNRARQGKYDDHWYQIRLGRHFMVWVGSAAVILGAIAAFWA